jgi:hypothetical protein
MWITIQESEINKYVALWTGCPATALWTLKEFSKGNKNESGVTNEEYGFYTGVSFCHN